MSDSGETQQGDFIGHAGALSVPSDEVGLWNNIPRIPIRTTMPEELLRHDISDEELDMLGDSKRGFFHEFMWASVTGTLGAIWGAGDALYSAFWAKHVTPLAGYGVWEIILCAGFLVLSIFSAFMVYRESAVDPDGLKERIRARTQSRDG